MLFMIACGEHETFLGLGTMTPVLVDIVEVSWLSAACQFSPGRFYRP